MQMRKTKWAHFHEIIRSQLSRSQLAIFCHRHISYFYAYIFSSPTNEKEKTVNLTCDATTSPTFLRKTNSTKRKCSHIKGYNHSRRRRYPIQRTDSDGSSFTNSIRRKLDVQSYVDYFWPQISGMVHRPSKYIQLFFLIRVLNLF